MVLDDISIIKCRDLTPETSQEDLGSKLGNPDFFQQLRNPLRS